VLLIDSTSQNQPNNRSNKMNQSDLVKAIADEAGLPQVGVESTLKALGKITQNALNAGEEVTLPGIGKLSVSTRAARTGRNPQTGDPLQIAAKQVPKFSAAKALKDVVAS
jgi:DNA-binding protein HU-beta